MFGSSPNSAQHYSVVLIRAKTGPFLLQKRTRRDHSEYAGKISLFGGRREGAETPVECAIREILEETGLAISPDDLHYIASVEAMNEGGNASFGSIFFHGVDSARELRRLKIVDGKAILVAESDVCRYWPKLTSIAAFALSAYAEMNRTGRLKAIGAAPFARTFLSLPR